MADGYLFLWTGKRAGDRLSTLQSDKFLPSSILHGVVPQNYCVLDDLHTALTGGDLLEEGREKGSRQKRPNESGVDLFSFCSRVPLCMLDISARDSR